MDYVLFGMGYGATLMLLGWALRTFGPGRKYKNIPPEDIDRTVLQRRWIRFIQGLGGVVSIAGTAMVLFTLVTMLINPDDETGSLIAIAVWAFLAISILVWCWFYVASFGTTGVWSREEGYGFRESSTTASLSSAAADSGLSTTRMVPRSRVRDQDIGPDTGPEEAADSPSDDASEDRVGPDAVDTEAPADDDLDPEYDFGDGSDTTVPSETGGREEAIRRLRERQARTGNTST